LNAYPTCYQDMSDEAVAKVAWAFAKHGIALHIDRGEMGGGTMIPHENNFRSNWSYYYENYFANSRHGFFHYCVMAHRDGTGSSSTLGQGIRRDDMFVLYDENIYSDTQQASVFMHELGHNINVYDRDTDTDGDGRLDRYIWDWNILWWREDDRDEEDRPIAGDGDNRDEDDDDDGSWENYCEDSNCAMKEGGGTVDYCSHHWSQVDLTASF